MNRTAVLNQVAEIIGARSYLEIGVFDPRANFDRIRCPEKTGVDPNVDDIRIVKTTSDRFFDRLEPGRAWDLIFIDGDHRHAQVQRDLANALKCLEPRGVVVMHDVDPADEAAAAAAKPSPTADWSGEAWRVLVERARTREDLRCATVDCDHGVALITRGRNPAPLEVDPQAPARTFPWLSRNRARALALIPAEPAAIRRFLGRASIAYYTNNRARRSIRRACFQRLRESAADKELIVVAQVDEDFFAGADRIEVIGRRRRGYLCLYRQMLLALEQARYDTVFLTEDDVLYPAGYFDFQLPDRYRFFYNTHSYVANLKGFFAIEHHLTSNCAGDRDLLALAVRQRIHHLRSGGKVTWAEPGLGGHDDFTCAVYRSPIPTVDVRHGRNFTGYRESDDTVDRLDDWGRHRELVERLGLSAAESPVYTRSHVAHDSEPR